MSKYDSKSDQELVSLLVSVSDVLGEEAAQDLVTASKSRAINLLETYDRNQERQAALARTRERLRTAALG
jgi:hypothetical protein